MVQAEPSTIDIGNRGATWRSTGRPPVPVSRDTEKWFLPDRTRTRRRCSGPPEGAGFLRLAGAFSADFLFRKQPRRKATPGYSGNCRLAMRSNGPGHAFM